MKRAEYTVLFPQQTLQMQACGAIYGYAHPETKTFNVRSCGTPPKYCGIRPPKCLGMVGHSPSIDPQEPPRLIGTYKNCKSGIEFRLGQSFCTVELYSAVNDVFSRNA